MKSYYEPLIPLSFPVRCADMKGSRPFMYHWHGEIELILVMKDTVDVGILNDIYHLKEGDMMIIGSGVTHYFFSSSEQSLRFAILFDPPLIASLFDRSGADTLTCRFSQIPPHSQDWPEDVRETVRSIILSIRDEMEERTEGYMAIVTSRLLQLSAVITRDLPVIDHQPEASKKAPNWHSILVYISENYTNDLSLKKCAEDLGFSMNYFSRLFHSTIGTTFQGYVMTLRLRQAEWFLINSPDMSITEVAFTSGFQSIKTFARVFKKEHDISPREFRKLNALSQ